jgi:uncharacterized protein YqjF (DUF2071 family)
MLAFLKKHPFAVEAFFKRSVVLTFAVRKEVLEPLIPECLSLDTFKDTWAFVAVAMVDTTGLRPKGFPEIMGNDFFLIGYRIFVQYRTNEGKRLRGLYILKSVTNKDKMAFLGNIFTHYNYTTTDIRQSQNGTHTTIQSQQSKFHVTFENGQEDVSLPPNSPFADWKEARRYAGPLPFTFTFDKIKNEVLIIEGVRENWTPQPLSVIDYSCAFIEDLQLNDAVLANAFIIKNIPYYWKKGRIEQWKQ